MSISKTSQEYGEPTKKIYEASDLPNFRKSIAFFRLREALALAVEKVRGHTIPKGILSPAVVTRNKLHTTRPNNAIPKDFPLSGSETDDTRTIYSNLDPNVLGTIKILDHFEKLHKETPPIEGSRRFGNLATRKWHEKIKLEIDQVLLENWTFPEDVDKVGFLKEIKTYILNSFGNEARLDFGTGHELLFLAVFGSLNRFGFISLDSGDSERDANNVLILFAKYYDLVRQLIVNYSLEPAGSHGVWGLDDHFHLIYILGAGQFNDDQLAPPVQQVLNNSLSDELKTKNLYVNAISFINKIKYGPFHEHSPIIFDIHSTVSLWSKVLTGLIKMYDVEVLGKYPVVQHFWFGKGLYPWKETRTYKELPSSGGGGDNNEDDIKFLNNNHGVKTTLQNVSLTGAPWAQNRSTNTSGKYNGSSSIPQNLKFGRGGA